VDKEPMDSEQPIPTPVTRLPDLGFPAGYVALTFDDGPEPPWTDRLLDLLEETGTPATFFVLGSRIAGREATLRRMVAAGCAVEVHSWEHVRMTEQDRAQRLRDIDRTRCLIRDVTGYEPRALRTPDGYVSLDVLDTIAEAGLTPVFWSAHAADWTRPGVPAIEDAILGGLDDGAIVLLHDGGGDRSQTVVASRTIIAAVRDRGLVPVSLAKRPSTMDGVAVSPRPSATPYGSSAQSPR
jgi:peptidoglycan/xylan/chitin deacetylase (PgdA/CDA1 family)